MGDVAAGLSSFLKRAVLIRPKKNCIHCLVLFYQVESGKLVLEETEFDLARELEGLVDMFSVQCINHNVETVLDLSGTSAVLLTTIESDKELLLRVEFETLHIVF